jgi:hypothetical protein
MHREVVTLEVPESGSLTTAFHRPVMTGLAGSFPAALGEIAEQPLAVRPLDVSEHVWGLFPDIVCKQRIRYVVADSAEFAGGVERRFYHAMRHGAFSIAVRSSHDILRIRNHHGVSIPRRRFLDYLCGFIRKRIDITVAHRATDAIKVFSI